MPERHLIVTPLPNGRSGNTGFLSVYFAPRLREAGILADYPDFRDWANLAAGLSAQILLDGVALAPGAITRVSPAPMTAAWRAVFGPPATSPLPVQVATFIDRRTSAMVTMDSAALASLTTELYRLVATLGTSPALRETVLGATQPILDGPIVGAAPFMEQVGNGDTPQTPTYEFHDVLRMLQAHPYLLRVLGLVMDFQINLGASVPAEVQVRTDWAGTTGAAVRDEVPLRMSLTPDFEPVVNEPGYRARRWLTLGGTNYAVTQGFSLNMAAQMQQLGRDLGAAPAGSAVDLPALEDGGLSIVGREQVTRLQRAFDRQRIVEDGIDAYIGNTALQPPLLRAEDVQSGFRIDVEDVAAPTFRSLYRRRAGGYSFPRNAALAVVPPDDEGWGSTALFTDGTPVRSPKSTGVTYGESHRPKSEQSDTTSWRLDDQLVTWSGWSLAVARPTRIVDETGTVVDRPVNTPPAGMEAQVIADYAVVPGSLPRLRYGRTYRFHARCVDLGGTSPAIADAAPPSATSPAITYGRTMPVPPPVVVRRVSRPDPGVNDTVARMVIRSELTQTDASTAKTHRVLFPPSAPQQRLEQHGLPNGGIDPASYTMLATRDALRLADQCLVDPDTGEIVAGAALQAGAVTSGPLLQPVNYLADAAGRAVVFLDPPGSATSMEVPYGAWPTYRSVTLELAAGTAAPVIDGANQLLRVSLPKGTTHTMHVASAIDPTLLPHFKWFQQLSAAEQAAAQADALAGRMSLFSPTGEITLVHAVRVPLQPPSFPPGATAGRTEVGQTTALLDGPVSDHGATSERLAIRAKWTDPVDDVAQAAPSEVNRSGVAGEVTCNGSGADSLAGLILDLGDNRRHRVDLDAEAFCRYSSYFIERRNVAATVGTPIVLNAAGVSKSSVDVRHRTTGRVYVEGTDFSVDAAAGKVTPLPAGAITAGTPLQIDFLRKPYSRRSAEAATGKKVTVDVPASARPAPPEVDHALPAFLRTTTTAASVITVRHDGRVMRVYLRRPWYSSGMGELLGVALDGDNPPGPYTTWARDATIAGTGPLFGPSTTAFPRAAATAPSVDGRFAVAAHDVTFDAERGLWACDIVLTGAPVYRPFLSLVLCRYQPLAIAGEHASETVAIDAMRLGADRTVRVAKIAAGINVRVTGPDNVNRMRVTVQQADPSITDPELRWTDVGAPTTLNRTGTTAASVHTRTVAVPAGTTRRLLVEDFEPVKREVAGALVDDVVLAYRETVDLPAGW